MHSNGKRFIHIWYKHDYVIKVIRKIRITQKVIGYLITCYHRGVNNRSLIDWPINPNKNIKFLF